MRKRKKKKRELPELKPCPFCGHDLRESDFQECVEESLESETQKPDYAIKCPYCDCLISKQWDITTAMSVWNQRVDMFVWAVQAMRQSQHEYFVTRNPATGRKARANEKIVDRYVDGLVGSQQ